MATPDYRASVGSTATAGTVNTATYPTGTVTNDLVLAVAIGWSSGAKNTPTGWTALVSHASLPVTSFTVGLFARRVASETSVTFDATWATNGQSSQVFLFTYAQADVASPSGVTYQGDASTNSPGFPALVGPTSQDYTAVRLLVMPLGVTVGSAGTGWTRRQLAQTAGNDSVGLMDKAMVGGGTAASSTCSIGGGPAATDAFIVAVAIPAAGYSMVI